MEEEWKELEEERQGVRNGRGGSRGALLLFKNSPFCQVNNEKWVWLFK
jgi:hypothetical protein